MRSALSKLEGIEGGFMIKLNSLRHAYICLLILDRTISVLIKILELVGLANNYHSKYSHPKPCKFQVGIINFN